MRLDFYQSSVEDRKQFYLVVQGTQPQAVVYVFFMAACSDSILVLNLMLILDVFIVCCAIKLVSFFENIFEKCGLLICVIDMEFSSMEGISEVIYLTQKSNWKLVTVNHVFILYLPCIYQTGDMQG